MAYENKQRPKPVLDARTGVKRGMATRSGALSIMAAKLNELTKQEANALTDAERNPDKTNKAALREAADRRGKAATNWVKLNNQLRREADKGNLTASKEVAKHQELLDARKEEGTERGPRRPIVTRINKILNLQEGGKIKKNYSKGGGVRPASY